MTKPLPNIILTGFMGTGKTAVSHHLAARLNRPLIDTDALIEQQIGHTIPHIFATQGEAAFRALERQLAHQFAHPQALIIATGGGLLVDPTNADLLSQHNHIFCLTASPTTIFHRLQDDTNRPLLQTADPLNRIRDLLHQRAAAYGRFPAIPTDNHTPEQVAQLIINNLE
ncbi:MAG TPA: shikimate kinase [Anaerolineae bacterium]|nr:shikimate kinase [Anaerolineae bacterium]